MANVKIGRLKAHLSEYLRRAKSGERVTIFDRDEAIAEIVPVPARESVWKRLARTGQIKLGSQRWDGPKLPRPKRKLDVAQLVRETQKDGR